jgi:hypothetical protein
LDRKTHDCKQENGVHKRYEQPLKSGAQPMHMCTSQLDEKHPMLYWAPLPIGDCEEFWEEPFEMMGLVEDESDIWGSS